MSKYFRSILNFKVITILITSCLIIQNSYSQTSVPFQFLNNSTDFADSDIYIGVLGNVADSGTVWINFKNNTQTNLAMKKISSLDNTVHKTTTDWGYAPIFTKLSDIANKTVYIPAISSCKFFIAFKNPLYIHFHATGGYAAPDLQNSGDPNNGIRFETIEMTNGSNGMWINTTRVDTYQYPMGLEVYGKNGTINTYNKVGELLTHSALLQRWQNTFINTEFAPCYVNTGNWLSNPQGGIILQPSKIPQFKENGISKNYFQDYINRIWNYYATNELVVSLGDRGVYRGKVDITQTLMKDTLKLVGPNGILAYISGKPNTQEIIEAKGKIAEDVLATPDKASDKAFQAQFSAAVNRGAIDLTIPGGQLQNWGDNTKYFSKDTYNKYVWFFHQTDISYDSKTYAFAYDDVFDQSSTIQSQKPTNVRITIGGFANIAPQHLSSISVSPVSQTIKTGANLKLTATGYDALQFPMTITPAWSSNGGTIDNSGNFSASSAGVYTITATVGELKATATITVEVGVALNGCELSTLSSDFTVQVSADKTNPSFTFVPVLSESGATTCLLFYSKVPNNWGSVGAHAVKPNVPYTITGNLSEKIYYYYVYSTGVGNKNSQASNDSFTIGSCFPSRVDEISDKNSLEIYPNPVKDILTLKFSKPEIRKISVYDYSGILLIQSLSSINQTNTKLDFNKLAKGIYFIVIDGESKIQPLKIIKE